MRKKPLYTRPESEAEEVVLLKTILDDSNTETFEGGNGDDITW